MALFQQSHLRPSVDTGCQAPGNTRCFTLDSRRRPISSLESSEPGTTRDVFSLADSHTKHSLSRRENTHCGCGSALIFLYIGITASLRSNYNINAAFHNLCYTSRRNSKQALPRAHCWLLDTCACDIESLVLIDWLLMFMLIPLGILTPARAKNSPNLAIVETFCHSRPASARMKRQSIPHRS